LWKIKKYCSQTDIRTVFCVNPYPLIYGWPVSLLQGRRRYRCIATVNTSEFVSLRDKFFMIIYGFILRRCDHVVFGSNSQAKLWTAKYRISENRATIIYNGVDTEYFNPETSKANELAKKLDIEEGAVVVGCVAQLRPEKSHRNLLQAAEKLRQISRR
jgi:glycosyltransferase involved in cell wall biosynthesis